MMLFTKDIDKKLFQQYDMGSNLEKQKVIAKIFNPYGNGRWFLINSDPQDPNYLWAIVQMGDTVEVGSVSRQDLISAGVGRFRFPLERDLGFSPVNAAELFRGLNQGKFYADGGETKVEEEQTVTRGFYEDEPYEYGDGGGIEREAVMMANNPNWTNEKLLNEYNRNKFDLSELNAGYLKPSKVIGGGYKSSAVAKRLAKEYLEKTLKEYKIALEIRSVMANGGEVKWQDARIGDSARVKSRNKMGLILKDYGRKFHLKFVDGTEKTYDASELEFIKDEDEYAKGGMINYVFDIYSFGEDEDIDRKSKKVFKVKASNRSKAYEKAKNKYPNDFVELADSYEHGGYMAKGGDVEDKFKGKNSKEVWNNLDSSTKAKVLEYLFLKEKSGDKQYYDSYNYLNELSYSEWDKLPKNIKKEIENFQDGGSMAKGGKLIGKQKNLDLNKNGRLDAEDFKMLRGEKMAMGAKVTFNDKVSSIKKSLLKKKTVSPKVKKDYGKTYNKKEALESAKRIAGAMKAKYRK